MAKNAFQYPADTYLLVGRVEKAQGLRGEIFFQPYSRQPENFRAYPEISLVDAAGNCSESIAIRHLRKHKDGLIVELAGITTRTQAEQIIGRGIVVKKSVLPVLEDGEYYWHQLIGLEVVCTDGRSIGVVASLFSNGSHDIAVVQQGKNEFFIPMVRGIFVEQNTERVVIDPPEGLLDLNDPTNSDGGIFP